MSVLLFPPSLSPSFPLSVPPSFPHSAGGVMFSRLPSQVRLSVNRGSQPLTHHPPSSGLARVVRLPAFI